MPRYDEYDDDDFEDIRKPRRRNRDRDYDSGLKPQSWPGMISVGIAALMFVSIIVLFAMIVIIMVNNGGNNRDPVASVMGLGVIVCLMITFGGLVLGIVGCCQSNRSMICGILGSIFNGFILLGVLFLMCMGIVLGP